MVARAISLCVLAATAVATCADDSPARGREWHIAADGHDENVVEDCEFRTAAAEAVDIKEVSEGNTVRRCRGIDSRDPDGAIFGSRGDRNRFEACVAEQGAGRGFRFGGDTVGKGRFGQTEDRTYGRENVMRNCRAIGNALWGAAPMVQPQDIDASNVFERNGPGAVRE
jgi:hypothetical protein